MSRASWSATPRSPAARPSTASPTCPRPSWPDAADLAELAHPRFLREETVRPDQLRPLYLRHPDAAIGWQARGRLQGGEAAG